MLAWRKEKRKNTVPGLESVGTFVRNGLEASQIHSRSSTSTFDERRDPDFEPKTYRV